MSEAAAPAVTIVIPCFNDGAFLGEAVASARAATERRCEILVVDDGSDDPQTRAALDGLRAEGVRVLDQPHSGPAAAYNAGFEAARGAYVLPLDADNRIRPRYPAVGALVLDREPGVGAVYGDADMFGALSGRWRPGPFRRGRMLRRNHIDSCAVIRRELWRDCGGYVDRMNGWEDWDLWLSAIERGWELRYVEEVLFDYRVRRDSVRMVAFDARRRRSLLREVIDRHPGLYRGSRGRAVTGRIWLRWALESALSPARRAAAAWRAPHPGGAAHGLSRIRAWRAL